MTDAGISWVDLVLIIAVAFSVLAGLAQGFFRSVFSLGGLVSGLALAEWNYTRLAAPLNNLVHNEQLADILSFILIAFVIMILASLIGSFFAKAIKSIGLGCIDRLAGGIFGFFQGILLVTVAILVTVAFYPQAHWLVESKLPRHFFSVCHLSTHMSPEDLSRRVRSGLKFIEGDAPAWMHPRVGRS